MPKKVTISVLLSVYNTDFNIIKRAINSVLVQDFQDFELIIIDDGSINDDQNFLLNYIKEHHDKIAYIWHTNRGQSKSINRGIKNCNGNYITIIDADDEYMPNHLSSCLKEMKDADLIASTTHTIVNTDVDYYVPNKHNLQELIHIDDCILFATLFGKKEVLSSLSFEDVYAADAHFYERAALQFKVKKVDLRTYIYYRNNPNSICSSLKTQLQSN
jgi:glycosyltransferase involved in cell wall biosynthesis